MPRPSVGRVVHYVSYGTPGGEFTSQCRAAIVTEVGQVEINEKNPAGDGESRETVGLCVLNPTGLFLNQGVLYDEGNETPGSPDCPGRQQHGAPFRYCSCGWTEAALRGGTWHWPERSE